VLEPSSIHSLTPCLVLLLSLVMVMGNAVVGCLGGVDAGGGKNGADVCRNDFVDGACIGDGGNGVGSGDYGFNCSVGNGIFNTCDTVYIYVNAVLMFVLVLMLMLMMLVLVLLMMLQIMTA
jgi:hypothetical protein